MTKLLAQCRNSVFPLLKRWHRPQYYSISRAPPPRLPEESPVDMVHLSTQGPFSGLWHVESMTDLTNAEACMEKRIAGYDLPHLLGFASFIAAEAARCLWLLKIGAMATAHVGQIHASVTSHVKLTKKMFQKLSGRRRVEI